MTLRSLLYVPVTSERFVARAHERGAGGIILDLEDSVPETEKDRGRNLLATAVATVGRNGATVFVRINAGTRQAEDALAACRAGAFGLFVPKVRSAGALDSLAGTLRALEAELVRPAMPFVALIEDPAAVLAAREIAGAQRVMGLALGGEDFATALGAEPTAEVLRTPKLLVHYAAKAAGKLSLGLLRSIADYADGEAMAEAAREAAMHGFDGATCIHPSAVPILDAAFRPSGEQVAWAERVMAAARTAERAGSGAFVVDGQMVDAPVIARARSVLDRAG